MTWRTGFAVAVAASGVVVVMAGLLIPAVCVVSTPVPPDTSYPPLCNLDLTTRLVIVSSGVGLGMMGVALFRRWTANSKGRSAAESGDEQADCSHQGHTFIHSANSAVLDPQALLRVGSERASSR